MTWLFCAAVGVGVATMALLLWCAAFEAGLRWGMRSERSRRERER